MVVGSRPKASWPAGGGANGESEGRGKTRMFLSGLILAGLLAGAAMLPDNKNTEVKKPQQGGSAQAGPAQVAKVDSGGVKTTANDAVDSAGTQDRRYFPGRQAM